jgi:hypothetical protein
MQERSFINDAIPQSNNFAPDSSFIMSSTIVPALRLRINLEKQRCKRIRILAAVAKSRKDYWKFQRANQALAFRADILKQAEQELELILQERINQSVTTKKIASQPGKRGRRRSLAPTMDVERSAS